MLDLLNFLSLKLVDDDRCDIEVRDYFLRYLNNNLLYNSSYDCFEIADDFVRSLGKGTVYKITSTNSQFFNCLEFGRVVKYVDHFVYTYKGVAYDPRLNKAPILWDDYKTLMQLINTHKLKFEIR